MASKAKPVTKKPNDIASSQKLSSLKGKDDRSSPTLRGGKNKVLPGIKKDKTTEKNEVAEYIGILAGRCSVIPPKTPTEVRIFLSSTFTDMQMERNTLAKEAYPALKDYCNTEHGLDFSVVDMRWGVTDFASVDHSTEELCLLEIENCHKVGVGPRFITMLGDRYGYRPITKYISEEEFDMIVSFSDDADILKQWYKRDENAVPPHYALNSITTLIPGYGIEPDAGNQWNNASRKLTSEIRSAVIKAHTSGKMKDERKHAFHMSVTESEIRDGLIKPQDRNNHCLCFIRNFTGLDDDALKEENSSISRFTDLLTKNNEKEYDVEAMTLRKSLQTDIIPSVLGKDRMYKYPPIKWTTGGVTLNEHQSYIDNFSRDFVNGVKELVQLDKHKSAGHVSTKKKYHSNYDEILHHLHLCKNKSDVFVGQENILTSVKEYLESKASNKPLVIYAESGGGKTFVMSKIYDMLPVWFGNKVCRVIRLLGTSPQSTTIYDVLMSLVAQLADVYNELLQSSNHKTMKAIVKYMPRFLRTVARGKDEKIVILLDSIDQLSNHNDAHKMKWLLTELPPNVHIIISTLPELHGILSNCRLRGLSDANMVEVKPLGQEAGKLVLDSYLEKRKRKLTNSQVDIIMQAFVKTPNMLYLKLMLDKAVKWSSFTPIEGLSESMGDSIQTVINKLFSDLENKFGMILVSHTLGYITAGIGGLTSMEIEDVLSCDDKVLDEVYQYHPPPVEGVVHIPTLLWARIRHDIKEYLTERSTHGKTTLFWYHRQFIEVAKERYTKGPVGKELHANLATLYLAENGIKSDIELTRLKKKKTILNADRQVSKQPLVPSNLRAIMGIPNHLRKSGNIDRFKQQCLFRLKFLLAKLASQGLDSVIEDIVKAFVKDSNNHSITDLDIETLHNCLLDMDNVERDPVVFTNELIARIPHEEEWIPQASVLVTQAHEYLQSCVTNHQNVLVPLHSSLYKKGDLFQRISNILNLESHINDVIQIQTHPYKTAWSNTEKIISQLIDFSGKFPIPFWFREKGIMTLLKEKNMAFHLSITDYSFVVPKDPKKMAYMKGFVAFKNFDIGTHIMGYGNVSKDYHKYDDHFHLANVPLVGRGEKFLKSTVRLAESSTQGNFYTLVVDDGHIVLFDRTHKFSVHVKAKDTEKTRGLTKTCQEFSVPGDNAFVVYSCYVEAFDKILIVTESTIQDEESKQSIIKTQLGIIALNGLKITGQNSRGKVYGKNKWTFVKNETWFVIPLTNFSISNTELVQITIMKLEDNKCSAFDIKADRPILDISYSQIGETKCYALTDNILYGYDLETFKELLKLKHNVKSARSMTIEDDGEYVYIGNSLGQVHSWKIENCEYLGFVDLACGSVSNIMLSSSDVNIAVYGEGSESNELLVMPQRHYVHQCKANRQIVNTKAQSFDKLIDFYADCSVLALVNGEQGNTCLLTFQLGQYKVWSVKTLEPEKTIPYDETSFDPKHIQYNSNVMNDQCILHDGVKAMKVNIFKTIIPVALTDNLTDLDKNITILATTQGSKSFFILSKIDDDSNKMWISVYNYDSSSNANPDGVVALSNPVSMSNIEMVLTSTEKFAVLKVECSEKELEILEEAARKTDPNAKLPGNFKFYSVDLLQNKKNSSTQTSALKPCYKNLTKVPCLGSDFTVYQEDTILLALDLDIYLWDVTTGKCQLRMLQGTKNVSMFSHVKDQTPYKALDSIITVTSNSSQHGSKFQMLASTTKDGWLNIFKENSENVLGKIKHDAKPNNTNQINRVCIAPNVSWLASVSKDNILRCWTKECKAFTRIQLDATVIQLDIDATSKYMAVLGQRNDKKTKLFVFKVEMPSK